MPKWTKVEAGFYRLEGTLYAVQSDGMERIQSVGREENTGYEGFQGGEWATIKYKDEADRDRCGGDNLDWYPTMREARDYAERCWRNDA